MSTIIYTITLQVLRLSVTRIIMFFVREQRVKIIGVLLFLNVSWTSGELPVSSYLPPNRDDQSGKFSSPSSFAGNSGEPRNPPSNTYGPPNNDNLSNNRVQSNIRGNNNANNFNRGGPVRNQQISAGNGYSYQQPRPPFKDPNTFGPGGPSGGESYQPAGPSTQQGSFSPVGNSQGGQNYQSSPVNSQQSSFGPAASPYGGQNYQSAGPANSQQSSFSPAAASYGGQNYQSTGPANSQQPSSFNTPAQVGQNYPSAGSTNSVPGITDTYFNTLAPSPSPTYGPPMNTSGGFEGGWVNVPFSSSNLPERKPSGLSPITLPNSYTPLPNNQIPNAGNSQGYSSNLPSLSNSYGPPSVSGSSFGNTPSFGGNFNPASNPFGSSSTPLNSNVNQFPSSGLANVPKIQSASNPGPTGTPQTLYGVPTANNLNAFANNANLPSRRPSGNFGGNGSPQTIYSPPIPSVQTPADSYSPQGNQNRGSVRPPSPTYGPPPNSLSLETSSQSFRPQEFEKLSQNTRPFSNSGAGYQNSTSNLQNPPSQLYGAPVSNTPNIGYNQGPTQNGPYPASNSQFSSISSPNPNNFNPAPNQRPSSQSPISSIPNSPQTGYPQRLQNQPSSPSPTYGSPVNQVNRTSFTPPSNTYQPPLQSFTNENTPQSSYLPPFSTFSNPSSSGLGTVGGYETSRLPNSIPSEPTFSISGGSYEAPRSPNQIQASTEFGSYEVPKSPGSGFGTSGGGYEAARLPSSSPPSRSQSPVNSLPPIYSTLSTNSLDQGFSSQNQQGYPGSQGSSEFGNTSPTEASRPSNFNSPSSNYGSPTRDYTDALLGDYNNPTSPEQGNTFFGNTNSFGEIFSTDRNTQQSQNPTFDQGSPAQSAYSGFSPNPSLIGESPDRLYGAPNPTNDFTNEQNSIPFTNSGSTNTNSGTQSELNFGTNPASSYLPPNQSNNNEDVVPSTSYTLPSDQPNSSQPGTSNASKNTHRNVGSDLITGASTSPFLPFKDDVSKPNVSPSRATYEKSQEITSNSLVSSGYDSAKPAKYQFNYDVKGFGPEFSHQESRNGSTTSGSYGVVLPDGRKQVVDYEANQEGFYPKIRYEETPNNSLQQNNDRKQGYNYSPNTPLAQNLSQSTPNGDSFSQGSSSSYPDSQSSYQRPDYTATVANQGYNYSPNTPSTQNLSQSIPSEDFFNQGSSSSYPDTPSSYQRPDYTGTVANQGSYSSPYDTPSSQSGYPINNQASTSNFNGYN